MSARQGILSVAIVAAVLVALSFAGIGSDVTTGIFWNIDGLLLLSVCLTMVLVFGAMLYFVLKPPKTGADGTATAPATAKPAAAAPGKPAAPAAAAPAPKPAAPSATAAANPPQAAEQK